MLSKGYIPLITSPSKFNPDCVVSKFTLIDHIWSMYVPSNSYSGVIWDEISDHFPVYLIMNQIEDESFEKVQFRLFNETNYEKFKAECGSGGLNIDLDNDCPDRAFSIFYKKLYNIYNSCFPVKIKYVKYKKI